MTRFAVPSGTPLAVAGPRSTVRGYGAWTPVQAGVIVTATSGTTSYAEDGAWAEVWAATTAAINLLVISGVTSQSSNRTNTKIDIAIGGAGAEVEHVSDVAVGFSSGNQWLVPCNIPVGSRVAIRLAQFLIGATRTFGVLGAVAPHLRPAQGLLRLDAGASNGCFGIVLTAPGGTGTEAAWTQLVASTAQPLQAIWLWPQCNGDVLTAAATTKVDVAVGSAGNEQVLFTDLAFATSTAEAVVAQAGFGTLLECHIPRGTRIAARYQSDEVTNTYDLALMGVPA